MEGIRDSPSLSVNEQWSHLEPHGPGDPGATGCEKRLSNLPAKLAFQFLFGSTPMQELPGYRDRVFLQSRFCKIHQGRNKTSRGGSRHKRGEGFLLGAKDGDGPCGWGELLTVLPGGSLGLPSAPLRALLALRQGRPQNAPMRTL